MTDAKLTIRGTRTLVFCFIAIPHLQNSMLPFPVRSEISPGAGEKRVNRRSSLYKAAVTLAGEITAKKAKTECRQRLKIKTIQMKTGWVPILHNPITQSSAWNSPSFLCDGDRDLKDVHNTFDATKHVI